jgi:hypothetical protein
MYDWLSIVIGMIVTCMIGLELLFISLAAIEKNSGQLLRESLYMQIENRLERDRRNGRFLLSRPAQRPTAD